MLQTMIIKADGGIKSEKPYQSGKFTLEEMQTAVNGLVEMIWLDRHKAYMLVNEEGKLLGLPFNSMATVLYEEQFGENTDIIVGDVLIVQKDQMD